ncbi:hypothetical protein ACFCX0_03620 [Streptomyces sp. NPDC056352]|uniref:hypothetical protein n=1 Tax=Streptomyces sp. NPDC056352 TaxID=3345791 RepID=UPI0035E34195
MSLHPYPNVFNADLATATASIREMRKILTVADVAAAHEEFDGADGSEVVVRYLAARKAGDTATLRALWEQAEDIDRQQPFGPRVVDQLRGLQLYAAAA